MLFPWSLPISATVTTAFVGTRAAAAACVELIVTVIANVPRELRVPIVQRSVRPGVQIG